MALLRGQPFCFWREPQEKEAEGSYAPEHGSRPCLRAPQHGGCSAGRQPGLPRARSGQAAAAAARGTEAGGSQRQRRGSLAGQRLSPRRPPPHTPPAAPAHLSSGPGSAHLPPSLPPAAAAGGGPEPLGSAERGARRCPSLSRRQLPLSLHPHIPPPAAAAAAAAAPKFTALRQHEVILPASLPGLPHSTPAAEGETAPSARPPEPRGALAFPPSTRGAGTPAVLHAPRCPGGSEGRHGPPAARLRVWGSLPGHRGRMGRSAPRQPSPLGSPLSELRRCARRSRPTAGGARPAPTAAPVARHRGLAAPFPTHPPHLPYRADAARNGGGQAPAALQGRSQGRALPPGELCVCVRASVLKENPL